MVAASLISVHKTLQPGLPRANVPRLTIAIGRQGHVLSIAELLGAIEENGARPVAIACCKARSIPFWWYFILAALLNGYRVWSGRVRCRRTGILEKLDRWWSSSPETVDMASCTQGCVWATYLLVGSGSERRSGLRAQGIVATERECSFRRL